MSSARTTRYSRAFVATGIGFLLAWNVAVLAGLPRSASVALGLQGFVFGVVFGKGYALIPSYFGRELAVSRAPAVHLPLAVAGVIGLALGAVGGRLDLPGGSTVDLVVFADAGAILWFAGVLVFVTTIGWTVRDNLLGGETGTGEVNAHRRRVDRIANLGVPFVLGYLLAGATVPVLEFVGLPTGPVRSGPPTTHLLAAGTATLLVFAVGFRLLPRFLVASVHPIFPAIAIPAGVLGPGFLVYGFPAGPTFSAGAMLLALAVLTFAVAYLDAYRRTDRNRVGLHVVAIAAVFGVATVAFGLHYAFATVLGVEAHLRLGLLGFLGLTIVGVTYQFYPPAIGPAPGVGDRLALLAALGMAVGLALEVTGHLLGEGLLVLAGGAVVLLGSVGYAYVMFSLFLHRR